MIASLKKIINFLLPQVCVKCQKQIGSNLCENCKKTLPLIDYGCRICGQKLTTAELLCGACLNHSPPFTQTIAPYVYAEPLDQFIINLKFHGRLLYAKILGELLSEHLAKYYKTHAQPAAIVPMPLHKKRLKERGFNQALEIAWPIVKQLKIPILRYHCERVKNTVAQTSLNAKERQHNVKQAFRVNRELPSHIAVIDDVITTGSTMQEFCKTLKKSGVATIDVWCCARSSS